MVSTARTPAQVSKLIPHTHTEDGGAQVAGAGQGQRARRTGPPWQGKPAGPAPGGNLRGGQPQAVSRCPRGPKRTPSQGLCRPSRVCVLKVVHWAPTPDSTRPTGAGPWRFLPGLEIPAPPGSSQSPQGRSTAMGTHWAPSTLLSRCPHQHTQSYTSLSWLLMQPGAGLPARWVLEEDSRHRGPTATHPAGLHRLLLGTTTSGGPASASTLSLHPQPPLCVQNWGQGASSLKTGLEHCRACGWPEAQVEPWAQTP